MGKSTCNGHGSVPTRVVLAFTTFLWELPWPWLCALAMAAWPMGASLILVLCLCHGWGLSWPWMHAGRHVMALAMRPRGAFALVACPLKVYFPK